MAHTGLPVTVATCDDARVTLGEYDAILREWFREAYAAYKEKTGISLNELAKRTGLHKPDLSNINNRRSKRRRNVSKEIFVAVIREFGLSLSDVFHHLSTLATRYEHGALKLDIAPPGRLVVRSEHAQKTRAIATEVSKRLGEAETTSRPALPESPSPAGVEPSQRKS